MSNHLITNFSGGMNSKVSPLLIKDTECELVVNYNLDKVGALTKRNGYDVFASQPVAAMRVNGLFQYTNTNTPAETTQVMVANVAGNANGIIYYNSSGTWTASKSNDTASLKSRFATFVDYLFRVNGTDVVASSKDVNGGIWGTTNCPATITPAFISVFQDRLYVAKGSASGQLSRVWFSGLPSAAETLPAWEVNDYFDVNPDDGDEIRALENNGNRLLIFKNRALYRWTFGQVEPDRLIGVGTQSQECVKTNLDLGITFFANEYGAYAYTGGRPKLISRKIQDWFDNIPATDVDDMVAETDADHYYLYLSDSMTVGGTTYTKVMAVYTISLNAWTIYTLNTPWRVASKLIQSNSEDIYFGSSNGRTYQWNSGIADDSGGTNGDTAVSIAGEIIFKEQLLNFPSKTDIQNIDTIVQDGMTANLSYQLDRGGDFKPVGKNLIERVNNARLGKEGQTIRVRITDNGASQSVIEGLNIEHNPKKER